MVSIPLVRVQWRITRLKSLQHLKMFQKSLEYTASIYILYTFTKNNNCNGSVSSVIGVTCKF